MEEPIDMPDLTKSKFKLDNSVINMINQNSEIKKEESSDEPTPFKRLTSINKTNKNFMLNFSKDNQPSKEEFISNESSPITKQIIISKPIGKTNRYFLDLKEHEIESIKKKKVHLMYGPCILIARSRKEYYKILSFRKYRIFKLKTIREIESKYTKEDKYFESIMDFKKQLEGYDEKNIRKFLRMFYMEE